MPLGEYLGKYLFFVHQPNYILKELSEIIGELTGNTEATAYSRCFLFFS